MSDNSTDSAGVTWTMSPQTGAGSINVSTGVYTAPSSARATAVTITATSKTDTSVKGTATIAKIEAQASTPITVAASGADANTVYSAGNSTANFTATSNALVLTPTPSDAVGVLSGANAGKFSWDDTSRILALTDDSASVTTGATLTFTKSGFTDKVITVKFTKP